MKRNKTASLITLIVCGLLAGACSVNIGGPPPTATPANDTERAIHQVELGVIQERRLDPKKDVAEHFITQAELRENYTKLLADSYSREEADIELLELWLLGFAEDPDLDLYQMSIDMFSNAIAGYYDTKAKELFVVTASHEDEFTPQEKVILAHEYIHSFQDQHFDIESKQKLLEDDWDRALAYSSVVEGDATVHAAKFARSQMPSGDYLRVIYGGWQISEEEVQNAPEYFGYVGYFPYDQGADFIDQLLEENAFDINKVNDALKDPPQSSEQILHIEKYINQPRDNPLPVTLQPLTDTLGAGWTFTHSNTIGEYDLQTLFYLNYIDNYEEAAAGWGGGRHDLYQNRDDALLIMGTRWDTEQDREEFTEAMEQTLGWMDSEDGIWSYDRRYFALAQSDDIVLYIASTDRDAIRRVIDKYR